MRGSIELVFCNECDNQIKNWTRQEEGVVFDCYTCGEKHDDEIRLETIHYEPGYDTTKERDLDRGL